jgi:hypothetical protein
MNCIPNGDAASNAQPGLALAGRAHVAVDELVITVGLKPSHTSSIRSAIEGTTRVGRNG